MLQLLYLGAQLLVFAEEGVARLPVALHQRMADKQLAAQQRIDGAVIDLARRDDRQTEQRDFFAGHHRPCDFDQCGSL